MAQPITHHSGVNRNYCEWVAPEARWLADWGEPFNTLTNLGFVVVGLWALLSVYHLSRSTARRQLDLFWVSALVVCIGLGSWLFHQTQRFVLVDVIPIVLMLTSYLGVWVARATPWRFMGRRWPMVWLSIVVFFLLSAAIPLGLSMLTRNPWVLSSSGYFGAWVILVGLGAYSLRRYGAWELLLAAGLFALSLTFRTLDQPLCAATHHYGLHTLWHLLNAACFFLAMRFLFRLVRRQDISQIS